MPKTSSMCALPAAIPAPSVAKAAPAVALEAPTRDTVLLVEDNDFVAGLLNCILRRHGQTVVRARDAAECERVFAEYEPAIALVILDWRLPDGDGASVCRRLRARVPRLPVLFTSGDKAAGQRMFDDGLTSFLAKPFLPADLKRQVDSLVGAIT